VACAARAAPHAGRVRGDRPVDRPFAIYYELFERFKQPFVPWSDRILASLHNLNQFQLPFLLLVPLAWLRLRRPACATPAEWRVVGLALALIAVETLWMSLVGPIHFYRYIVGLTPLSAALAGVHPRARGPADRAAAFATRPVDRGLRRVRGRAAGQPARRAPAARPVPQARPPFWHPGWVVRTEWRAFFDDLLGAVPIPTAT